MSQAQPFQPMCSFYQMDDFGNADKFPTFHPMRASTAFIIDGRWEGVCDDILPGTIDEDSLRYFGLV